jgi:hypothetical protein
MKSGGEKRVDRGVSWDWSEWRRTKGWTMKRNEEKEKPSENWDYHRDDMSQSFSVLASCRGPISTVITPLGCDYSIRKGLWWKPAIILSERAFHSTILTIHYNCTLWALYQQPPFRLISLRFASAFGFCFKLALKSVGDLRGDLNEDAMLGFFPLV